MKATDISPAYHQVAPPPSLPFHTMYAMDGVFDYSRISHTYKVCPSCGVPSLPSLASQCSCGTYIWVCFINGNKCVQAFAIPDPIFLSEEDTI